MDWEPEIPGQFETPRRILRKRAAPDTGFSDESAVAQYGVPILIKPVIRAGNRLVPNVNVVLTTFRILYQLFSATVRSASTTCNSFLGSFGSDTTSKRVVEIRQLTTDGNESVKRRAAEFGVARRIAPTNQQISRNKRQTTSRKSPRKLSRQSPKPQMASISGSSSERSLNPREITLADKEALGYQEQHQNPPIDREALGAKLFASFTPRPLPGLQGQKSNAQSMVSVTNDESAAPSNRKPRLDPVDERREGGEINKAKRSYKTSQNTLFPQTHPASQMRRSSLPSMHTSHQPLSNTNEGSRSLRARQSQPPSLVQTAEQSFARSVTTSKTPKQVRFAINPSNGQPVGTSKKFFKESIVGEWAPSSPWSEEQARETMSDLNAHLKSLETGLPWSPPPSTSITTNHSLQHKNFEMLEDPHDSPEPNNVSQPQNAELPDTVIQGLPLQPNHGRAENDSTPNWNYTAQQSAANTNTASASKGRPYLRIKEIWKGSVRQIFFAKPLPTEPPEADDGQITAQEAVDSSIEMTDAPLILDDSQNALSVEGSAPILSIYSNKYRGHLSEAGGSTFALSVSGDDYSFKTELGPSYGDGGSQEQVELSTKSKPKPSLIEEDEDCRNGKFSRPAALEDSSVSIQKQENGGDLFLELAMSELKMSGSMRDKLGRRRREREAERVAREAAEKAKAEAEEAARRASSGRRLPKQKLVQPLSKAWAAKIEDILRKGDHVALATTLNGTELKRKDFMTVLGDREWLNDEIINAYLEWIVEYANEKAGKNGRSSTPKVIGLNSFFYKNISTKGPSSVSRWMSRKRAGGKKLLEVETVLIPVNNANHWTIIVVSPKERTIEYLDSFAGSPKVFVNHAKAWLAVELGSAWHEEEWRVLDTKSTEQLNGYDCGVFTITNAECVAGGIVTDSYDTNDMAAQRRRIAGVLLNRGFGGEFTPAEEL